MQNRSVRNIIDKHTRRSDITPGGKQPEQPQSRVNYQILLGKVVLYARLSTSHHQITYRQASHCHQRTHFAGYFHIAVHHYPD